MTMKTDRVVYDEGRVALLEPVDIKGRVEGVLVLPDPDPWEDILQDPTPRPSLSEAADKALRDFRLGRTRLLDPETL